MTTSMHSELKEKEKDITRRKRAILVSAVIFLLHMANMTSAGQSGPDDDSKHFVLVHGSCHGAWSWYKLVALLKSSGHNVTALDLAASGINLKQVYETPSVSDYFRPLMEFMASLPPLSKVILVAHSLGGLAISQAMEMFPEKISAAVFITATMPGPDLNISTVYREAFKSQDSQIDNHYTYDNGPKNPPTAFMFGPKYLAAKVYQLSPPEDLALATTLLRPLPLYDVDDMSTELKLSTTNYGSVHRIFIKSDEDKVSRKDFQEWMIEKNAPDEVEEIIGSDHMVMMSRPVELSLCLQDIAKKYS